MSSLAAYLYEGRISQADFGQKLAKPVSQQVVCRWLIWLEWRDAGSPGRSPARALRVTAERALQIEAATGREVPRDYLRPDLYGADQQVAA